MSLDHKEVKTWIESIVGEPVIVGNPNIVIYKTMAFPKKFGQLGGVVVFKDDYPDGPLKASFVPFGMDTLALKEEGLYYDHQITLKTFARGLIKRLRWWIQDSCSYGVK